MDFHVGETIKKKTTQSGIWETGILCPRCDGQIGHADNYAYQVLPAVPREEKFKSFPMNLRVYELGIIDLDRFRLFLAALAWRSAQAKHRFFEHVSLGPYEPRLKEIILGTATSDTLETINALVVLLRPTIYDSVLWPPCCTRIAGVNVVQFYLFPWKLILKLDRRDFGYPFEELTLRSGKPAYAFVQTSWTPGESQSFQRLRKRVQELTSNSPSA